MTIAQLLRQEGYDQGLEQGRQEGRHEGRHEGRAEVAVTMLNKGLTWETVTEYTGLTQNELALTASKTP